MLKVQSPESWEDTTRAAPKAAEVAIRDKIVLSWIHLNTSASLETRRSAHAAPQATAGSTSANRLSSFVCLHHCHRVTITTRWALTAHGRLPERARQGWLSFKRAHALVARCSPRLFPSLNRSASCRAARPLRFIMPSAAGSCCTSWH